MLRGVVATEEKAGEVGSGTFLAAFFSFFLALLASFLARFASFFLFFLPPLFLERRPSSPDEDDEDAEDAEDAEEAEDADLDLAGWGRRWLSGGSDDRRAGEGLSCRRLRRAAVPAGCVCQGQFRAGK